MKIGNVVSSPSHLLGLQWVGKKWLEVYPKTPHDIAELKGVTKTFSDYGNPPRTTQSPILVLIEDAKEKGWK